MLAQGESLPPSLLDAGARPGGRLRTCLCPQCHHPAALPSALPGGRCPRCQRPGTLPPAHSVWSGADRGQRVPSRCPLSGHPLDCMPPRWAVGSLSLPGLAALGSASDPLRTPPSGVPSGKQGAPFVRSGSVVAILSELRVRTRQCENSWGVREAGAHGGWPFA